MNRRSYLALFGTTLGSLGGCVQSPGRGPSTPPTDETTPASTDDGSTPTPTTTADRERVGIGEHVTIDGTSVTVANPRVRLAIPFSGMHVLPLTTDVGQFVVVDVTVDGSPAAELDGELAAVVDGERVQESSGQATTTQGSFGVPFPVGAHETAAVRRTAGSTVVEWGLPGAVRTALAETPAFRVTSFESRLHEGQRVVELTVRNDGGRDGQFLGRLSFEGFSGGDIVSFGVPAGESERYSGRPGKVLLYFENDGGGTLTLQYPGPDGMESVEHTVSVDTETGSPASTATETPTVVDQ
ncbi:hypothetical protein ACFQL1_07805 [Halomicroarcula sp. GCM10025709]|uniref:hypothetical protein n=1 Tax=Haloarcula TaxID=2237 RepID=UPI0024C2EA68|nr:hypothetical protein [Halomicroarcula sp. YJ-61-S]